MSDTIEAQVIEPTQALAVRPAQAVGLFGTVEPVQVIEKATAVASALKDVLKKQGLISNISGKEYPKCEAWTLLGTMLGVFPVLEWCRAVDNGWEARVLARTKDGATVGAAEAECLRSEKNWQNREDFALRSMAQTRATAKCLRMPLGFVMTLAGYEATPAEEMTFDHPKNAPRAAASSKPPSSPTPPQKNPPAAAQTPKKCTVATAAYRTKMIQNLKAAKGEGNRRIVTEYFQKVGPPHPLMPTEELEELPLRFVPINEDEMKALEKRLAEFEAGEPAVLAFEPHWEGGVPPTPAPTSPPTTAKSPKDDEFWRDVIITVPRKGMKKADYERAPDTIGKLFDMRHGNDEESEAARQRLFGLVHSWEAKAREHNGKIYQPSAADLACRAALDAFWSWWERTHPDEKF